MSSVSKGAYYKGRTKKYLIARGYQVADMEKVHRIFGTTFSVKKDQFGADLLAVSATEIVFVQVKGAGAALPNKMLNGAAAFAEFTFPPSARRWVIGWRVGARKPEILDAVTGKYL